MIFIQALLAGIRGCEDEHNMCDAWAASGECSKDEDAETFMRRHCAEACGWCTPQQEDEVYDPHIGRARAVLETPLGELHIGFYEALAPVTTAHIMKLVRLGGCPRAAAPCP